MKEFKICSETPIVLWPMSENDSAMTPCLALSFLAQFFSGEKMFNIAWPNLI
jgi:hypothetical protein